MARKKKQQSGVASLNPDNMASAGLADDFDGVITRARFVPWNYNGAAQEYSLAVAVQIEPDEEFGFDPFTQYYSVGDLQFFVPSQDGEEPVDIDAWDEGDVEPVEGIYAYQVGRRESLSNSSNFAHFMRALVDAGYEGEIQANIDFLEGIRGHFNRVDQKKRSGIVQEDDEGRRKTILVLTEIESTGNTSSSGAASSSKSGANDELADEVSNVILEAVAAAGDDGLPKRNLAGLVMKSFKSAKQKSAAVKIATSNDFLSDSDLWDFDADEGVLTLS